MPITPDDRVKAFMKDHKYSHLLRIDGFSLLPQNEEEFTFPSSIFEVHGYNWKLLLNPCWDDEEGDVHDQISLHLEMQDTISLPENLVVTADVKLFVLVQQESRWYKKEYTDVSFGIDDDMFGEEDFISRRRVFDKTKGYLVNDSVIFGAEITKLRQTVPSKIPRLKGTGEVHKMIQNPPKSKFTWKITKFSSFNKDVHFSNDFTVGQRKWRIKIQPKGENGSGDSLSVFLVALDYIGNPPQTATLVNYKLRVLDQLHRQHQEVEDTDLFGSPGSECGEFEFLSLKKLHNKSKGYLVNDVIYIGVEFKLVSVAEYLT